MSTPPRNHHAGDCSWCFGIYGPLGYEVIEFNGGYGHPECVEQVYETLSEWGALPEHAKPRKSYRQVISIGPFLETLGTEAARQGIDVRRLAAAVTQARAAHG